MQLCMYVYKHRCKFVRLFVRKLMQARMFVRIYMDLCLYVKVCTNERMFVGLCMHTYTVAVAVQTLMPRGSE